jgi:hypothetical protein
MPRSLEPNSRIVFVLECDKDKTPQPRAFGRTLSISGSRKLIAAMGALQQVGTLEGKLETAIDAAMSVLTGWENMIDPDTQESIAFSREALGDVYTIEELSEILSIAAGDGRLTADERKKSESQPLSPVENSVPPVPVDAADL